MNRSSGLICDQPAAGCRFVCIAPPFCLVWLAVPSAPAHSLDLGSAVMADKAGMGLFLANRPTRRERRESIPMLHSVWIEYALTTGGTK
jgi:hypothetical protein